MITSEIVSLIDEAMMAGERKDRDHMFAIVAHIWSLAIKASAHRSDVVDAMADRLSRKECGGPRAIHSINRA